jgi:hypothetical protein
MYVAWICHIFLDPQKYRKDDMKGLPIISMTGHGLGADGGSAKAWSNANDYRLHYGTILP